MASGVLCAAPIGIALIVIGALGLHGIMNPHAFGWTTFGVSLSTGFVVLPIIAALSAYGIVSTTAVAGVAIASGAIAVMIGGCLSAAASSGRR